MIRRSQKIPTGGANCCSGTTTIWNRNGALRGSDLPHNDELSVRAWSALFVSYCAKVAGAGDSFAYSPAHIVYMRAAAQNNQDDVVNNVADNPFRLHDLDDEAVAELQPGDIVCGWRHGSPPADSDLFGYENVLDDLNATDPPHRPAHCEIVVTVGSEKVMTIGGNVSLLENPNVGVTVRIATIDLVDGRIPTNNPRNIMAIIRVHTDLEDPE